MAHRRGVRVTRPARLGLIALAVAIIVGAGIYTALKVSRSNGYQFGVHFPTAAGVSSGAQVYLSGVNIGNVAKIIILPDTSVDFIVNVFNGTDIPKSAKFTVLSSLTGSPSVAITVPGLRADQTGSPAPLPPDQVWPKRVLPVSEQPYGSPPLTLEIFMHDSRALGNRATAILAKAKPYGKPLMAHLQNARVNGAATVQELRGTAPALLATVQSTITRAKANVQSAQAALRAHNQQKITQLATSFQSTIADMHATAGALQQLKRDPRLQSNVRAASVEVKSVTANLAGLTHDMEMISGNSQTKAQLRDAGARLRSILKSL